VVGSNWWSHRWESGRSSPETQERPHRATVASCCCYRPRLVMNEVVFGEKPKGWAARPGYFWPTTLFPALRIFRIKKRLFASIWYCRGVVCCPQPPSPLQTARRTASAPPKTSGRDEHIPEYTNCKIPEVSYCSCSSYYEIAPWSAPRRISGRIW